MFSSRVTVKQNGDAFTVTSQKSTVQAVFEHWVTVSDDVSGIPGTCGRASFIVTIKRYSKIENDASVRASFIVTIKRYSKIENDASVRASFSVSDFRSAKTQKEKPHHR